MNYFIATSGRAGSSLLYTYLKQLGAGRPQTWLDPAFFDYPFTLKDVSVFLESKRYNGVLGVKLSWWYIFQICNPLGITFKEFLHTCMPNAKCIYLTRRDRIHQGLSRTKHDMLNRSHAYDEEGLKEYKSVEKQLGSVDVPTDAIKEQVLVNSIEYVAWENLFTAYGITPFRLTYEDFVANKTETCRDIFSFLDLSYPPDVQLVDERLATHSDINDRWHKSIMERQLAVI